MSKEIQLKDYKFLTLNVGKTNYITMRVRDIATNFKLLALQTIGVLIINERRNCGACVAVTSISH
jgi:hypothetical protein